jgi:putative thioredoxin
MSDSDFSVNDYIFDASSSNFKQLVLENSQLGPVLVHFWSPKAGPSFRLYPVLEKMVADYAGVFLLVNINVDEDRKIAQDYAITSVPTLKLFIDKQVHETLFGYQNDSDLRFLLDQYVASENDKIIRLALTQYDQGNTEQAYRKLGQAALKSPYYYKLPLTIASLMRTEGRYQDAIQLIGSLPEQVRQKPACIRLLIECDFAEQASPVQNAEDLIPFVRENMQELPALHLLAAWYVTQKDYPAALELFNHIMQLDRSFEDDLGRRSIVKILSLLEINHPLALKYRDNIRKINN